jgi:hypothetical protein
MTSNSIAFSRQSTPKTDDPKVTATVFGSLAQTEVLGAPQTNESGSAYAGYGLDAELRAMVRGEDRAEMMFYRLQLLLYTAQALARDCKSSGKSG